jgi:hypothetical protein
MWLLEAIERDGAVKVAVKRPLTQDFIERVAVGSVEGPENVVIRLAKLRWMDGTIKPIYITDSEVLALTLKPEWLPGQRLQVQNLESAISWLSGHLKRLMKKYNLDGNS